MLYQNESSTFLKISDMKNANINPELYKTFFYVAKCKNVSEAARKLYVSQPAISRSIRNLETRLGCMLFFRNSKGVSLTKEGEILFTYVEMALNFMILGEKKIEQLKDLTMGELNIGVGDSICKHYLLPFLKRFHAEYPRITIHITNQKSFTIAQMLKAGEIDLGLLNLPLEDNKLRITRVMDIHDCFVVGEKYQDLAKRKMTLKELSKYPLLVVEKGSNSRVILEKLFEDHQIRLNPSFELGNFELLMQFAAIDFGVACVVREFFADELQRGVLHEIPLKEQLPARGIGIASLSMVPLSPAAKAFIYLLVEKNKSVESVKITTDLHKGK